MVKLTLAVTEPAALLAVIVADPENAAVGTPEIVPVEVLSVSPGGKLTAENEHIVPVRVAMSEVITTSAAPEIEVEAYVRLIGGSNVNESLPFT